MLWLYVMQNYTQSVFLKIGRKFMVIEEILIIQMNEMEYEGIFVFNPLLTYLFFSPVRICNILFPIILDRL